MRIVTEMRTGMYTENQATIFDVRFTNFREESKSVSLTPDE